VVSSVIVVVLVVSLPVLGPVQAQDAPVRKAPGTAGSPQAAKPSQPRTGGSGTLVILNVCAPMAQLSGWVTGPTASVKVDGRQLGTVEPCSSKSFSVPSGDREVIVRADGMGFFDLGLPGPRHVLRAGQSTYISAVHRQYFETREVDAATAKSIMDTMRSVRKK
jgi:hypothetical protein